MALSKIQLRPGVNVDLTQTANEGGFSDSQLIRFFAGQVQKMGGWTNAVPSGTLIGTCRGMIGWADQVGSAHVALGTEQRLSVLTGGVINDITPVVQTDNLAPALATTASSTVVTITDAGYTPSVGDWINLTTWTARGGIVLSGFYLIASIPTSHQFTVNAATPAVSTQVSGGTVPSYATTNASATITVTLTAHGLIVGSLYQATISTAVGGLTIFGTYDVASVTDANTFTIAAGGLATSTTSAGENGGNMQIQYLLPSGLPINTALGGYGIGDYGAGDWGLTGIGTTSALIQPARTWSMDHYGQNLIASPDLGKIYYWAPPAITPAVVLDASAPTINKIVFSIAQAQIIMACGSEAGGTYFPTFVRWCDSGNFTAWVATTTNQAGSYQIPTGSYITAAVAIGLGALIWTDVDLWAVTYQGLPYVFGFNSIAVNCEAISKKAPAVYAAGVVWPSGREFFRYQGGAVMPLASTVWDYFYNNIDTFQADLVCSGVNTRFNEVIWFFPASAAAVAAAGAASNIWYVKWNYVDNVWDKGILTRTAWIDHSPYGNPLATTDTGTIYMHETGNDADGVAMIVSAKTGYYDIAEGEAITYVGVMIPDFIASSGSAIQIGIWTTNYPGETPQLSGPYTVTPSTTRINAEVRARQVAFEISSRDLGSSWRMGAVRYNPSPAGTVP